MKVSVVIPTYNEANDILDCIESLGKQTFEDFEIIVVDDGSSDNTLHLLRGVSKTLSGFKYMEEDHKGAGAARNLGARHATGKILVFVDADMTFDQDFVRNLIKPIINGEAKGTWSREEHVSNWGSVWARCWNINEGWETERRHPKNYPDKQKVFRAVLKSEFDRVDGFDLTKGYMDDWSLGQKLGYDAVNAPGAIFYHKNSDSLGEIFQQAKWIGKRPYKLGGIGKFYALLRASLPESLWEGLWKSLFNREPRFIIFKVVYDLGIFSGILEQIVTGKASK